MLMKIDYSELARSVLAVPPFALTRDLEIDSQANAALIRHMEGGGVSTLLYGGNANVHNWPVSRFADWLDALESATGQDTWLIPSVGPGWGKLLDEAAILKHRRYPAAMVLPMIAPQTPDGVLYGIESFVERSGVPLIVYIKTDQYVPAKAIGRLAEQGVVFGIKYAVPRKDLAEDAYLVEAHRGCRARAHRQRVRRAAGLSAFDAIQARGLYRRLRLHRALPFHVLPARPAEGGHRRSKAPARVLQPARSDPREGDPFASCIPR